MAATISPSKAVILMGERRSEEWPAEVPSVPHPVIARLERSGGENGAADRVILRFEHGVTGYEAFEATSENIAKLRKMTDVFVCAGGSGWASLKLKGAEIADAYAALSGRGPFQWVAHCVVPDANGKRQDLFLLDKDGLLDGVLDAKFARRHFERELGLDPDRDLAQAFINGIKDKTPKKFVDEVVLAPAGRETEIHWTAARRSMREAKETSFGAFRAALTRESEQLRGKAAQKEWQGVEGILLDDLTPIGAGTTAGVRGAVRTADMGDVAFVAFGDPAKRMADHLKKGDAMKIGGWPDPQRGGQIKVRFFYRDRHPRAMARLVTEEGLIDQGLASPPLKSAKGREI